MSDGREAARPQRVLAGLIVGTGLFGSTAWIGSTGPGQCDGARSGTPLLPPAQNLGIHLQSLVASDQHVVFRTWEAAQRADLTGDGDAFDFPAYHYDARRQRLVQLGPHVRQHAGELPVVIEGTSRWRRTASTSSASCCRGACWPCSSRSASRVRPASAARTPT